MGTGVPRKRTTSHLPCRVPVGTRTRTTAPLTTPHNPLSPVCLSTHLAERVTPTPSPTPAESRGDGSYEV